VLDFPTWKAFTDELAKGYTHVGISFIVPNVLKAKRMAETVRAHHPGMKIILGGYGTIIPDLADIVPHD
ncbi:MAG: radical SAM protein, partial [Deltaproteobacteria bacterium]|nr:radical SAM protein [Deltaproteobacteria bacterium]